MARFSLLLVIVEILFQAANAKSEDKELHVKRSNKQVNTVPCRPDWFYFDGKCYKVGRDKADLLELTWDDAAEKCVEYGGHLATISTSALQRFFVLHFLMAAKRSIWIGLYKHKNEKAFEWHDGTTLIYTNWAPNEPSKTDSRNQEDCVEIMFNLENINGKWNNYDCNVKMPFVCQMQQDFNLSSPDARYCPETLGGGWRFRDFCFNFVREEKSWDDAEEHCAKHYHGHLATISDGAIKYYIDELLDEKYEGQNFWIGIHFQNGLLQQWTSGRYVDLYIAKKLRAEWRGQNSLKYSWSDSCAYISREKSWKEDECKSEKYFICQLSRSNKSPVTSLPKVPGFECPEKFSDWVDIGGDNCYYFNLDLSFSWHEANFKCMQKGGFLTSIHSQNELNALGQIISFRDYGVHIGLLRHLRSGKFIWADGSEVYFEAWEVDEPNDFSEKCVELNTGSMKWNDIPCKSEKRYICSARKISANKTLAIDEQINSALNQGEKHHSFQGVPALNILGIISTVALIGLIVVGLWCYFQPWGKRNDYVRSR